jgi:hypothetical protein
MALLRGFEIQKDFPKTDISDSTAEMLELMLLNRELVDTFHTSAELINFLYRFGHKTMDLTARPHLDDATRLEAFSYGIETFEAVGSFVRPLLGESYPDEETATRQIMTVHKSLDEDFASTLVDAKDRMKEEMPRTTHVIAQSALRFYRPHADYALSGAAIAREVEVLSLAG